MPSSLGTLKIQVSASQASAVVNKQCNNEHRSQFQKPAELLPLQLTRGGEHRAAAASRRRKSLGRPVFYYLSIVLNFTPQTILNSIILYFYCSTSPILHCLARTAYRALNRPRGAHVRVYNFQENPMTVGACMVALRSNAKFTIRLIGSMCKCGLAYASLIRQKRDALCVSVHATKTNVFDLSCSRGCSLGIV